MRMIVLSHEDENALALITHEHRKKQWLSTRILLNELTGKNSRIVYDEFGKPSVEKTSIHISLSHSHDLIAMVIDSKRTGVDIELIKSKIQNIASKFMSGLELLSVLNQNRETAFPENRIEQLYVYWCAKEALYKLYGKKQLFFKENIIIHPFKYRIQGEITGEIITKSFHKKYKLHYEKINGYMMVYVLS